MSWNKKGETIITDLPSGGAAAVVLAIVTLIIVMYIIFLPAADRNALLNDDSGSILDSDGATVTNKTLFSGRIGTLGFSDGTVVEHSIPNTLLVETKNAVEFAKYNPFIVKNGWFTKQKEFFKFHIDDVNLVKDVFLSFVVPRAKGTLRITLNGNVVFEGEPNNINVEPVALRNDFLKRDNELLFAVDGVGFRFWSTNNYNIEKLKVVGDVTDEATQEAINTFVLTDSEMSEMESATLDYYPNCANSEGILDISLNGRKVFSGLPDCNSPNRHELNIEDLNAGKNTLIFSINKGSYLLEQIRAKIKLKEAVPFVEFFDVSDNDFNLIQKNKRVKLRMTLVDDNREKRALIKINSRTFSLQQEENIFERDITRYVEKGENSFQILPKSTLYITKAEIIIE